MKKLQNGSALIPFIIVLPALILIAGYSMSLAVTSFRLAKKDQLHTHAQLATDAGIDLALQQINLDDAWNGTASEVELLNDGSVRTTYQITVTNPDPDNKTVTATGRAYRPVNAATAESLVKVVVNLRPVRSGDFSVVTGVGGLYLSNSAKIVGGDVFVNGEVSLQNSSQIGLSTSPVTLQVAHQNCPNPADATYPRLCSSGENGQPISIANTAHIYGDVKANNQTSGTGMSDPGLTASSGVTPQSLPPHDRDAQKAAIATTITGADASCSGSQTRTWAANTKITGNVTVSNNCQVTVQGDVWITGKLTAQNSTKLIVADALGTTRPVIMVDDIAGAKFQNTAELKSNTSDTGFQVMSYWSAAACSPDCADVTGLDLFNSRNTTTVQLDNSASGPETIFYARWSRVQIVNSGQIGALVGQTVQLQNSGTITFGTSASTEVITAWIIDGYRRVFN
ncbi:hypothetical protein HY379_01400 [Candidatus Saccharibacteria bacterium]|nr:hypothetical protein [Candidatus Saccharibacteria bacterium]